MGGERRHPGRRRDVNSVAVNGNDGVPRRRLRLHRARDRELRRRRHGGGHARVAVAGRRRNVYAVAPDGANGFYIGGFFNSIGTKHADNIAHIKSDGTLDTSWTGSTNGTVYAIAVSDDTVFAGGAFSTAGGAPKVNLAAFNKASGAVVAELHGERDGRHEPVRGRAPALAPARSRSCTSAAGSTHWPSRPRSNLGAVFTSRRDRRLRPAREQRRLRARGGGDGAVYAGGAFTAVTIANSNLAGTSRAAFSLDRQRRRPGTRRPNGQVYALDVSGTTVYAGGGFSVIGGAPATRPRRAERVAAAGRRRAGTRTSTARSSRSPPRRGHDGVRRGPLRHREPHDRPRQPRGDRLLHGHRDDLRAGRRRRGRRARGVRARTSASAASSGRPAPAPTSRATAATSLRSTSRRASRRAGTRSRTTPSRWSPSPAGGCTQAATSPQSAPPPTRSVTGWRRST